MNSFRLAWRVNQTLKQVPAGQAKDVALMKPKMSMKNNIGI